MYPAKSSKMQDLHTKGSFFTIRIVCRTYFIALKSKHRGQQSTENNKERDAENDIPLFKILTSLSINWS